MANVYGYIRVSSRDQRYQLIFLFPMVIQLLLRIQMLVHKCSSDRAYHSTAYQICEDKLQN